MHAFINGFAFKSDDKVMSVHSLFRCCFVKVNLDAKRYFVSAMNCTVLHLVHCAILSSSSIFMTLNLQLMQDLNELTDSTAIIFTDGSSGSG